VVGFAEFQFAAPGTSGTNMLYQFQLAINLASLELLEVGFNQRQKLTVSRNSILVASSRVSPTRGAGKSWARRSESLAHSSGGMIGIPAAPSPQYRHALLMIKVNLGSGK